MGRAGSGVDERPRAAERFAGNERRRELLIGMRDSLPFVLSAAPFAFACGLMGSKAGLSLLEIIFMALVVYAGTAQFIGISLIQAGAGAPLIILSSLVVNLRYLLQGLSLSPFLSWLPVRWLAGMGFFLVDEAYALSINHYLKQGRPRGDPLYFLGCTGTLYVMWVTCNVAGGLLGSVIGDPTRWGLDFALPAAFICIVLGQLTDMRAWLVLLVAGAVALVARELTPGTTYLILAAVTGTLLGVALEATRKGTAAGAGPAAGGTAATAGPVAGGTAAAAGAGSGAGPGARSEPADPAGASRGCGP